jgi:cupin fold WbuC family metalloprotein
MSKSLITLTPEIFRETLERATASPRRRAIYCFHKPDESFQRMINVCLYDTCVQPHMHENPSQVEVFSLLYGRMGVLTFNDEGKIESKVLLEETGGKIAEIPPATWHSLVVVSPMAVVYELNNTKYNPLTHKTFAPWAPSEDSPEAPTYRDWLRSAFP